MPEWIIIVSKISLIISYICTLVILFDISSGHFQRMRIMNIVWPVTTLYSGPVGLWFYFKVARLSQKENPHIHPTSSRKLDHSDRPFWQIAAVSTTHCGAGCALGDLFAEWIFLLFPFAVFGYKIFGGWTLDYAFAFLFGIAFQYFNIKPMHNLGMRKAFIAAIKSDFFSLTAWQIGMYGWMAIVLFGVFRGDLPRTGPVFWFMMQIAMIFGFSTSYPVNRWLIKKGIKEKM